jgi:hypothetical protein
MGCILLCASVLLVALTALSAGGEYDQGRGYALAAASAMKGTLLLLWDRRVRRRP